jgi:hypothetical protein
MNFFEQELRKIAEHINLLQNRRYIGRTCFGTIGDDIRARLEFVQNGVSNEYPAVKATILNRTEGQVDSMLLRFDDLFGRKSVANPNFKDGVVPHIWVYNQKAEWYAYHPSEPDYRKIAETLEGYMQIFQSQDMSAVQEEAGGMVHGR